MIVTKKEERYLRWLAKDGKPATYTNVVLDGRPMKCREFSGTGLRYRETPVDVDVDIIDVTLGWESQPHATQGDYEALIRKLTEITSKEPPVLKDEDTQEPVVDIQEAPVVVDEPVVVNEPFEFTITVVADPIEEAPVIVDEPVVVDEPIEEAPVVVGEPEPECPACEEQGTPPQENETLDLYELRTKCATARVALFYGEPITAELKDIIARHPKEQVTQYLYKTVAGDGLPPYTMTRDNIKEAYAVEWQILFSVAEES